MPFAARLGMIEDAVAAEPRFGVAVTEGGLFIAIARELRETLRDAEITLICGRDAAERIVNWDYGEPGAFAGMLREFEMLVASRHGEYVPPAAMADRIRSLSLPFDHISATEVRERIRLGDSWEHLVPAAIKDRMYALYKR